MARAGVTTERLTLAAAELADEAGFENVTVSALARRFGVKDASLYSHIRNAQDLRIKVALLALEELADRVADSLAGRAGKDALVAFANAYRDYAKQHPGRYAAMQQDLDPETAAASAGGRHAEMTRAILRGYQLSEPDQTDAVRMMHSTFHGYVSLERTGGFRHHPRTADVSWSRTLDALDTLLRNWPATSTAVRTPPPPVSATSDTDLSSPA
ncbi:TetR family transcriptional regulator [Micromonospora pisi]|uniref:TetR family transcriptional regulator n=1 Tax=Micromonospora pisi TaxID=589240 RepID=A0A495JHV3_9ACTN|nr:TetR family transcriptional regulator [Micromonospora pisi]